MLQKNCIQKQIRIKYRYRKKDIISPEKRQQIIDELRLVQYNNGISKNNKFV